MKSRQGNVWLEMSALFGALMKGSVSVFLTLRAHHRMFYKSSYITGSCNVELSVKVILFCHYNEAERLAFRISP